MKYITFKKQLELLKDFLNQNQDKEKKLSELFGGDTYISSDDYGFFIEKMLDIIVEEMGDFEEMIDWLFWDNMMMDKNLTFSINNIEYDCTIKNVWLYLRNTLNEFTAERIKDIK